MAIAPSQKERIFLQLSDISSHAVNLSSLTDVERTKEELIRIREELMSLSLADLGSKEVPALVLDSNYTDRTEAEAVFVEAHIDHGFPKSLEVDSDYPSCIEFFAKDLRRYNVALQRKNITKPDVKISTGNLYKVYRRKDTISRSLDRIYSFVLAIREKYVKCPITLHQQAFEIVRGFTEEIPEVVEFWPQWRPPFLRLIRANTDEESQGPSPASAATHEKNPDASSCSAETKMQPLVDSEDELSEADYESTTTVDRDDASDEDYEEEDIQEPRKNCSKHQKMRKDLRPEEDAVSLVEMFRNEELARKRLDEAQEEFNKCSDAKNDFLGTLCHGPYTNEGKRLFEERYRIESANSKSKIHYDYLYHYIGWTPCVLTTGGVPTLHVNIRFSKARTLKNGVEVFQILKDIPLEEAEPAAKVIGRMGRSKLFRVLIEKRCQETRAAKIKQEKIKRAWKRQIAQEEIAEIETVQRKLEEKKRKLEASIAELASQTS
jgi:hypothetical protein